MQLNKRVASLFTHEGAKAKHISPEQQLKRSVMACMLWEDEAYEDGKTIAARIAELIPQVDAETCAQMAAYARTEQKLRHVPLWIAREMARHPEHKKYVRRVLGEIIQRPDELTEFLAMYWKDKKQPLSAQVKKGLADAFGKFKEYQLAKYNRDSAIKLRDVLFLCHAKPKDAEQDALWKRLIAGELATPDTWEVAISGTKEPKDKKTEWTRLLTENKMGALALLRNLRNMQQAGVDGDLITAGLSTMKTERVLPFRFLSAAKHAPQLEEYLEQAMFKCLEHHKKLLGKTVILVDVSGSMDASISAKSDLQRIDAAAALAMLAREIGECTILTFSNALIAVPPRRGFALKDVILNSQPHSGTDLGGAIMGVQKQLKADRIIVITDEQSQSAVPDPVWKYSYMINVASNKNGVGYGKWTHIDGWSESVLDYIQAVEAQD